MEQDQQRSGSTLSGQSNSQLTVGTASNAGMLNQWRLLRVAEDPENEDLITAPQTNPALANFSGMATVVVVANLVTVVWVMDQVSA